MSIWDRIFGKKDNVPTAPAVDLVGQPHYINLPPSDARAIARHLARIRACRNALNTDRSGNVESLQAEVTRRTTMLGLAGISVPTDDAALDRLITQYGG